MSTDVRASKTVTPATERIVEAVREGWGRLGRAPSIREIGDAVGLRSSSTVQQHIETAVAHGLLRRTRGQARTLLPVGGACPLCGHLGSIDLTIFTRRGIE